MQLLSQVVMVKVNPSEPDNLLLCVHEKIARAEYSNTVHMKFIEDMHHALDMPAPNVYGTNEETVKMAKKVSCIRVTDKRAQGASLKRFSRACPSKLA